MSAVRIGTRGSKLALKQTDLLLAMIREMAVEIKPEIIIIKTTGDTDRHAPLYRREQTGFFTRQIEKSLLEEKIDMAVHSFKDLPTESSEALIIGAVIKREDPSDVLIAREGKKLSGLHEGARIGTGSLRRKAQLLHYRPDLKIIDIRGNLDTRIRKLESMGLDGIIVAYAGVKRMGLVDIITEVVSPDIIMPAAAQGAIGIQVRKNDYKIINILKEINHPESFSATMAERSFLKKLGSGCSAPVGVYCRIENNKLHCKCFIASIDGSELARAEISGRSLEYETLGHKLAERLLESGGKAILKKLK